MDYSDINCRGMKFVQHPEESGWYGISPNGDMLFFTQKEYEKLIDKLEDMELAEIVREREGQAVIEITLDDL